MSNKIWSLLFLLVPILGCATFIYGYAADIWLPEDISEHGRRIDHLFYFILWLTGVTFVATEVAMCVYMWRYDGRTNTEPVKFTHGNHSLELVWTIVPSAVLLFIAIYQMDAWAGQRTRKPAGPPTAEVTGRQFEWRIRYPGPDGQLHTPDDIHDVNVLHVPVDEESLIVIKSADVLHSFFLPNLRIKQDVVPGMKQHVWFKAKETGKYDIVCAELCGWGHFRMKGQVTVESRPAFDAFLREKYEAQQARYVPGSAEE